MPDCQSLHHFDLPYVLYMAVTGSVQGLCLSFCTERRKLHIRKDYKERERGVHGFVTYFTTCFRYTARRRHRRYVRDQNKIVPDNTIKETHQSSVTVPNWFCSVLSLFVVMFKRERRMSVVFR